MAKGLKVAKKRLPKGKSAKRVKKTFKILACGCGEELKVTSEAEGVECALCLMRG